MPFIICYPALNAPCVLAHYNTGERTTALLYLPVLTVDEQARHILLKAPTVTHTGPTPIATAVLLTPGKTLVDNKPATKHNTTRINTRPTAHGRTLPNNKDGTPSRLPMYGEQRVCTRISREDGQSRRSRIRCKIRVRYGELCRLLVSCSWFRWWEEVGVPMHDSGA